MFFIVAGIQLRTVELETQPRRCSSCGLLEARLKRVDHYFSVFFIPLFRVKKGRPLVECRNCGSVFSESGEPRLEPTGRTERRCRFCGKVLDLDFRYCPSCGKPVR